MQPTPTKEYHSADPELNTQNVSPVAGDQDDPHQSENDVHNAHHSVELKRRASKPIAQNQ